MKGIFSVYNFHDGNNLSKGNEGNIFCLQFSWWKQSWQRQWTKHIVSTRLDSKKFEQSTQYTPYTQWRWQITETELTCITIANILHRNSCLIAMIKLLYHFHSTLDLKMNINFGDIFSVNKSTFVLQYSDPWKTDFDKVRSLAGSGMGIKNGKVSWKVGGWAPQKALSGGPGGNAPWSWRFSTKIRRKNCIKQPCIFQFCQFLTWCKTITF